MKVLQKLVAVLMPWGIGQAELLKVLGKVLDMRHQVYGMLYHSGINDLITDFDVF